MRNLFKLVIVTSVAALAPAASALGQAPTTAPAEEPVRPTGLTTELGNERLSDELRLTRYAHAYLRAKIRREASEQSPSVGRLRFQTEDGPPEVYLVLRSYVTTGGATWLQIRVPGRPNGRTGWVPRDALGPLQTVRTHLRIDRRALRATLYRDGRRIWTSRVGVGKRATPTPAGRFWIRELLRGDFGLYGPWAFGTAAYSRLSDWPGGGVVGIHGTDEPHLIPGRPSHGCIRVPNRKIVQLKRLMPIGTPVRIV